jgi:pimeloyl-ACP methyl ester carboxylesterase
MLNRKGHTQKGTAMLMLWLAVIVLLLQCFPWSALASPESTQQVKQLNFVFLHGLDKTSYSMQLLADSITEQAQAYVSDFEHTNPGTKIQINMLQRSYPNDVDIATWADNIADSVIEHFTGKGDLIIIGHSMGGKAALYAVAHNIKKLADLTTMVVTINSPVKNLDSYYVSGGGSVTNYIHARWLLSDQGVSASIGSYDSSNDGQLVSQNKHWLAFLSAESAPLSPQFDINGIDGYPHDMDDGLVPISAQYSEDCDAVYYGEWGHDDLSKRPEVAGYIADQVLLYLFGGTIESPVLAKSGVFEHHAGWFPVKYHWKDELGEIPGASGVISHTNSSFFKWQEWEDIVGESSAGSLRSNYEVRSVGSLPLLTSIKETRWLDSDNPTDLKLYVKTRAAPRRSVQVQWNILQNDLLPSETKRDHYEIKIIDGTSLSGIPRALWVTDNVSDTRLQVWSQAEGPFRWYKAEWKVYSQESRSRKVIDEIPVRP